MDGFGGREEQVQFLQSYLCQPSAVSSPGAILIHGPPGTGKSVTVSKLLRLEKVPYTWIAADECLSVRVILGRILRGLAACARGVYGDGYRFWNHENKLNCPGGEDENLYTADSLATFIAKLEQLVLETDLASFSSDPQTPLRSKRKTKQSNGQRKPGESDYDDDNEEEKKEKIKDKRQIVVVLDRLDKLSESPDQIFTCLSKLEDVTWVRFITFVMIVSTPVSPTVISAAIPKITFPAYSKETMTNIMLQSSQPLELARKKYTSFSYVAADGVSLRSHPHKISVREGAEQVMSDKEYEAACTWFWYHYVRMVIDVFFPLCGPNIDRLWRIALRIWKPFTLLLEQVEDTTSSHVGKSYTLEPAEFLQLYRRNTSILSSEWAVNDLIPIPAKYIPTSNQNAETEIKSSEQVYELSALHKYILCAAYLASYNPAKSDAQFFSQAVTGIPDRKRLKMRSNNKDEGEKSARRRGVANIENGNGNDSFLGTPRKPIKSIKAKSNKPGRPPKVPLLGKGTKPRRYIVHHLVSTGFELERMFAILHAILQSMTGENLEMSSSQSKRETIGKRISKIDQVLLGKQSPLDATSDAEMLATLTYGAMTGQQPIDRIQEKRGSSVALTTAIDTLCSIRYLVRGNSSSTSSSQSAVSTDYIDSAKMRWRINIGYHHVRKMASQIGFPIDEYIVE